MHAICHQICLLLCTVHIISAVLEMQDGLDADMDMSVTTVEGQIVPTLGELVHEGIDKNNGLCNANYQQGLAAHQSLRHPGDGCCNEHLHA